MYIFNKKDAIMFILHYKPTSINTVLLDL